VGGR
jgi:hypothetical protein